MKARAAAIGVLVAALVGCGSKPLTNNRLASDLATQVGISSSLVCWNAAGKLGGMSLMGYDRICGASRSRPTIYVRTGIKEKPGWCLVTPRLLKAPRCPL
jgi:hypothetical protein